MAIQVKLGIRSHGGPSASDVSSSKGGKKMPNLLVNASFEQPLAASAGWRTSGDVERSQLEAFERQWVAALSGTYISIVSQLARVPEEANSLLLAYAIRQGNEELYEILEGTFEAQIRWLGSANVGLPLLRVDTVDVIYEDNLANEGWLTRVTTTEQKPLGSVWAQLRFIHRVQGDVGTVLIDHAQ